MNLLVVPRAESRRYFPDLLEVEAVLHALDVRSFQARFSDAEGRERRATRPDELRPVSGVLVLHGVGLVIVRSDAPFAFAPVACSCGEDALVEVDELYKRTHGRAPGRLLAELGLGRALRGRCARCRAALDADEVPGVPFAHFGVVARSAGELPDRLCRATGLTYRAVPLTG
jgi:hypothetical protein